MQGRPTIKAAKPKTCHVCGASADEADANARLIAAAPEMYELLKEAEVRFQTSFGDRIRAALARVVGCEHAEPVPSAYGAWACPLCGETMPAPHLISEVSGR